MERIFTFTDTEILYNRCILASIAHAIMVGEYDLLSAEQSWDGSDYLFQNMEGVRGVISFKDDYFVCVIQNCKEYISNEKEIVDKLLNGADRYIQELAKNNALQYLLTDDENPPQPSASAIFWGTGNMIFSEYHEQQVIEISDNIILSYLYNESDAIKYWSDYYEMTMEQYELMLEIYRRKVWIKGQLILESSIKNKLFLWFGDNAAECISSFKEMNILF